MEIRSGGEEKIVSLKVVGQVSLRRWYLSKDLKEVRRVSHVAMWRKSTQEEERTKGPKAAMPSIFKGCVFKQGVWLGVGKRESARRWGQKSKKAEGMWLKALSTIWRILTFNLNRMRSHWRNLGRESHDLTWDFQGSLWLLFKNSL